VQLGKPSSRLEKVRERTDTAGDNIYKETKGC
jgi:hypothetical protein